MLISIPCSLSAMTPQEEEKQTKKGVSVQMYQRERMILGGARGRGGGVGASGSIHDFSVNPFAFF